MKANYKDNPNKNFKTIIGPYIRLHVFEPEESVNQEDWYKDMSTFSNMQIDCVWTNIYIGDVIEDDSGARFRIISRHWKWDRDDQNKPYTVLEFTGERYMRHGKQNPYMI